MLTEIIRELTKIQKNTEILSENVLHLAKRVEAQRAQSAIISSLTGAKGYDKLIIAKNTYKDSPRRSSTQIKTPTKQTCRYYRSSYPPRQCPAYGKTCTEYSTIGHFRGVYRSRRARAMNEVEQTYRQCIQTLHIQ